MKRAGPLPELARFRDFLQRYRFAALLASLIVLFAAIAAVYLLHEPNHRLLAGIAIAVVFDLMLLSAVNAVCETRRTMTLAVSLAIPAAVFSLLSASVQSTPILVINNLLTMAFITLVIILVLGFLFRNEVVDANLICASLCIYLLFAVVWASLYTLCEAAVPGSFTYAYADQNEYATMLFGAEKSLIPIYYSFVTLTTLGYGDIVPTSPPARILAALEAVVGQIYLTVLVARLVGLHISHSTSRRSNTPS